MFPDSLLSGISAQFSDAGHVANLVRLILCLLESAALGALVGWERKSTGKAAGLRTHMLLCMGTAFVTLVPVLGGMSQEPVSRVIQGTMAGIGFVGGGVILKSERLGRITGLTTATGLWMTAGIGIAVGLGNGLSAAICGLAAYIVLHLLRRLEHSERVRNGQLALPPKPRRRRKKRP